MKMKRARMSRVIVLVIITVLLVVTIGLAVPSINVSVQGLGAGKCEIASPSPNVNVAVEWNVTSVGWLGFRYNYVLSRVNLSFPTTLPAGTFVYLNMTIYGYNINTGQYQYDTFTYNSTLDVPLTAGEVYQITNDNTYYTYRVSRVRPRPRIVEMTIILSDGYSVCTHYTITLNVQKIGIATLETSPSGNTTGVLNITVTEQKGQDLTDYVVNFTLSGDWSSLHPWIYDLTDAKRLYYWYTYDPESGKTWFWVKLNLSAYQTKTLQLYYGNQSNYNPAYDNPYKVFWYFNTTLLQTDAGYAYLVGDFRSNVSQYGVDGYALITKAKLGPPADFNDNGPAYFVFSGTYGIIGAENVYYGEVIRLRNSYRRLIVRLHYETGGVSYTGGLSARGILFDKYLIYQLIVNGNDFTTQVWQNGTLLWDRDFYNDVSWLSDSLDGLSPLYLGQIDSGTSYYSWRAVRPYVYPEPSVEISGFGGEITGDKYIERFVLYFIP